MPRLTRIASKPKPGIVHLGPGAFFRAFFATFTEDAMAAVAGDWGIIAVSLRSTAARDELKPQDHAFSAVELGPNGRTARVIGAVSDVLVAPEEPDAVIDAMSDPATKIISLTISEKGYGFDPATGGLDPDQADIAHDLASPTQPKSAVGFLVAALERRRKTNVGPLTVLSCDNLPSNGDVMRAVTLDFAKAIDARELAEWIANHVTFPCSMVDRITPATTKDDLATLKKTEGYDDPAAVFHEPFRQWVIEDRFAAGRPAWDKAGAQFVKSVEAHEVMKLRCLNGTHSTLAYLGYLAGHETIADCVADTVFAQLCQRLWATDILPTVPRPEGEDFNAYTNALLARYRNPAIRHRTWQIAMDGSQKLPQRILAPIADNLPRGHLPKGLCLTVAAWMRYVGGVDENGGAIDVRDPLATELKVLSDSGRSPDEKVDALLSERRVFPKELASDPGTRKAITCAYRRIAENGARAAIAAYLDDIK